MQRLAQQRFSLLQQMIIRPYFSFAAKVKAAEPVKKPVETVQKEENLLSASAQISIGLQNITLSVPDGLDYDKILSSKKFGITNQSKTFKSFEDEINKNFGLEPSAPVDRLSKRVGLVGYKVGMTHFWDKWGKLTPCTVIQVDRVQVTQIKTFDKDGVNAIQVGIGEMLPHKMKKPQIGHLMKNNLPAKRDLAQFTVTPENFLPLGYCLGPRHFKIGQLVDCQATSKGKGFQGVIKRWNFHMQNASHGVSLTHRAAGSISHATEPGKVFKGKKMAGHMGHQSATVGGQKVVKIDTDKSLLYIQGNVPGPISGLVKIKDATKYIDKQVWDLLYPTFISGKNATGKAAEKLQIYEGDVADPWENDIHENDVVSGTGVDED